MSDEAQPVSKRAFNVTVSLSVMLLKTNSLCLFTTYLGLKFLYSVALKGNEEYRDCATLIRRGDERTSYSPMFLNKKMEQDSRELPRTSLLFERTAQAKHAKTYA